MPPIKNEKMRINVLEYVRDHNGMCDFKNSLMAERLHISRPWLCIILNELESDGFIERDPLPQITAMGKMRIENYVEPPRSQEEILLDYLAGIYHKKPDMCCTEGLMMCMHDGNKETCYTCLGKFMDDLEEFDKDPFSRRVKYGKQVKFDV